MNKLHLRQEEFLYLEHAEECPNEMVFTIDHPDELEKLSSRNREIVTIGLPLNEVDELTHYLCRFSKQLDRGAQLNGHFESLSQREARLFGRFPARWNPLYYADFLLNRALPKMKPFGRVLKACGYKTHRVLSVPELLGRLAYSGFEILNWTEAGDITRFSARKVSGCKTHIRPVTSLIYKIPKVGSYGRTILIYRIRTTHLYAEFLDKYVQQNPSVRSCGEDFRQTDWGKLLSRFSLDRLPQLINLLRGDVKLVGVRPVSHRYFEELPKDLQYERRRNKPGCIPPDFAQRPVVSEAGLLEAEGRYLDAYRKNALRTDLRYLCASLRRLLIFIEKPG